MHQKKLWRQCLLHWHRHARRLSVMVSSRGQEIFISLAFLRTFDTVFRDTLQLNAMFRSLKFRLWSLMISRYLVIVLTLLIMYLHQSVYDYSIRNLCNGFHKSGIMISLCRNSGFLITGMMVSTAGGVALCCRKCGSQTPDRWLNESRNTQFCHRFSTTVLPWDFPPFLP